MTRLIRVFGAVVTCGCLTLTPAFAGQHGHHAVPTPATAPSSPPAHPAGGGAHAAPTPVAQKITANPALVARLQPLLPRGMTLASAAAGFRNQGQFIAALHVSRNLNIPFAQLKAQMTGPDHDSLGQAIHDLQPTAHVKTAVKTAEQQAKGDLKASTSTRTAMDKGDR